jgi:hypothetical protein
VGVSVSVILTSTDSPSSVSSTNPMLPVPNRFSGIIAVVPSDTPLAPTHVQPPGMIAAAETPFPLKDLTPATKAACKSSASVGSFWGSQGASEQPVNFRASKDNMIVASRVRFIIILHSNYAFGTRSALFTCCIPD